MYINRILMFVILANLCRNTIFVATAPILDAAVGMAAHPTKWRLQKEFPCSIIIVQISQRKRLFIRRGGRTSWTWKCHVYSHADSRVTRLAFSQRDGGVSKFLKALKSSPGNGFSMTKSVNARTIQNSESLSRDLLFHLSFDRKSGRNILRTEDKRCLRMNSYRKLHTSRSGSDRHCLHFEINSL